MSEDCRGQDPQLKFRATVIERMEDWNVEAGHLSEITKIPKHRLLTIMSTGPGAALFSDLIALATFFEISIDSFFT
jgi:hypothetical protein